MIEELMDSRAYALCYSSYLPRMIFWVFFMQKNQEKRSEMQDAFYMKQALELAGKGIGFVNPNPLVGALIVKDGRVIGRGWHEYYGGPHAEINAIKDVKGNTENATIYVSLEPCSHYGKTPPCSLEIIRSNFSRVVIGCIDPNPLVTGQGIELIRNAGIEVEIGIMEKEVKELNEVFFKFISTRMPFVVMKIAMSLDGKIATKTGDSKWISGEKSRKKVHELRNQYSGIMLGINTVIKDDPLLNVRTINGNIKNPIRIVVDSKARISLEAKIINSPEIAPTIIAVTNKAPDEKLNHLEEKGVRVIVCPEKNTRVNLRFLMQELAKQNIDSILLEGGGTMNSEAIHQGIVDKVIVFIAPKIIGGAEAITPVEGMGVSCLVNAVKLENLKTIQSGQDIMVEGYLKKK